MDLAITGTTGRLGRALSDGLKRHHRIIDLPRCDWDLSDPMIVGRIMDLEFETLLHPAAMTSLELCEDHPDQAWRVNADVVGELAKSCNETGRKILYYSTSYVICGDQPKLYDESNSLDPRSVYAKTKAAGERHVLEHGGCVMRVSWIFGSERPAFPDKVVDSALCGEPIAGICDKTCMPTYTKDLVAWTGALLESELPNEVIHACNSGEPISWHGMAEFILEYLYEKGVITSQPEVERQYLEEFEFFRAYRPRHTAMATNRLAEIIGSRPRSWQDAMKQHVDQLIISR